MNLENERERGNISEDTEIVGDEDEEPYLAYAEVRHGPWRIEFERGRKSSSYLPSHPERVKAVGPFIPDEAWFEVTTGVWSDVTEAIGSWDYVELCDEKF